MQINGSAKLSGAPSVDAATPVRPTEATEAAEQTNSVAASPTGGADEVSISEQADLLSRINDIPDIRQDRVDQIRTQIANGTYETQEKVDIAVSRLLDEIA